MLLLSFPDLNARNSGPVTDLLLDMGASGMVCLTCGMIW